MSTQKAAETGHADVHEHYVRAHLVCIIHRVAAVGRLADVAVVGMEYFGSQPEAPLEACITAVGKCQAYIGIFAMRYGSIDPLSGKSITHLEYEEAQRLELPSLIYLLDEDRQPILPKYVDTGESAAHLNDLKNNLKKQRVVSYFTTPDDLAKRIVLDVPSLAQRAGAEVHPSELAEIVAAIPRIDWLCDERFAFLVREMGPLAAEIPDRRILREVLEFLLSGDRQAAVFLLCRTSHPNIRKAIDFDWRMTFHGYGGIRKRRNASASGWCGLCWRM